MSGGEITTRDALTRLGNSTAEAIEGVLRMFLPDGVERGEVSVLPDGSGPFANLPFGAVAASVSYVDGVTGANIFVMTPAGARALAVAMGCPPPPEDQAPGAELDELEFSAVGEAANQMMAATAAAIGVTLGQEIEISVPDTRVLDDPDAARNLYGSAPHATSTSFLIAGESCRLIQLVPSAFVVRMVRAIDELGAESAPVASAAVTTAPLDDAGAGDDANHGALPDALRDINLRVWAELGRTQLALGSAIQLPLGAVVDLDRPADSPVELFVNGLRFAQGHLIVTDDGEWAICVEELSRPSPRSNVPALVEALQPTTKGPV